MERLKQEGKIRTEAPAEEYYDYVNRRTGEVTQVPVGIDPGWDYNPGEAAWGRRLAGQAMQEYAAMKAEAWEGLTPGDWQTYGLAEQLAPNATATELGPKIADRQLATAELQKIIGGEEKAYSFQAGNGFRYDLLVNAEVLVDHLDLNRTPFLPLIPETLESPDEVWMRFDRHKGTGRVVLRQRIIKLLAIGGKKGLLVVCDARNGWLEAWTMMPVTKDSYVNSQRTGQLVYGGKK